MPAPQPLSPSVPATIARAVVAGIRQAVPDRAPLFDATATAFVALLVSRSGGGTPVGIAAGADAFREAGAAEQAAGGDLDRLTRAYQAGGRSALPVVAALGRQSDGGVRLVGTGVEAVLRCVDVLIRLSTEAYRAAQTPSPADLRRDLLRELMAGRPWADLATRAGWAAPDRVVAVVVAPGTRLAAFDPAVLADLGAERPYLLLPETADPAKVLGGLPAAVGPAVRPAEAATSLHWARRTWDLRGRGLVPWEAVLRWPDHLTTHWLLADELLTGQLAARSLAPLSGLSPNQREKLAETLDAVLAARGGAPEVAARLGVHPQTARNRLRRLRMLFGARLDDPAERLNLRIALRAGRLLDGRSGTAAARAA